MSPGIAALAALAGALALSGTGCIFLLVDEGSTAEPSPLPPPEPRTNDPPSVESISIPDWPPLGPDGRISITVADDHGLSEVEMRFARTSVQQVRGTRQTLFVPAPELGEGFGELVVRVTDLSGGWAERRVESLLVDLSAPTIDVGRTTVPATGDGAVVELWVADAWVLGKVELHFRGTRLVHDLPQGYPSTLGQAPDGSLVTFDAADLPAERGMAIVRATDAAGNEATEHFDLYVDGMPPEAAITTPAPGDVIEGRFRVVVDASDEDALDGVDVRVGGVTVATAVPLASGSDPGAEPGEEGTATVMLDAADFPAGPTAVAAVATDRAGNESPQARVEVVLAGGG